MPYYCTVPRCTSMAGKAKNVSFHQFPRDEELAKLWNNILKRGKPYTKYSKVCSLHFRPDDYTITSGQKNKGQWRTLRKDAIPSRNLPNDSPVQYQKRTSWTPPPTAIDAQMHQQMAQAIYVQTMLAMQAASISAINNEQSSPSDDVTAEPSTYHTHTEPTHTHNIDNTHIADTEQSRTQTPIDEVNIDDTHSHIDNEINTHTHTDKTHTYKCTQCAKCFKDPDVFLLHKRTHGNTDGMLKANPILANLLKSESAHTSMKRDNNIVFNVKNVLSIENQIMAALTANMENYLRNLSTIMTNGNTDAIDNTDTDSKGDSMSNCDNKDFLDSNLIIDED